MAIGLFVLMTEAVASPVAIWRFNEGSGSTTYDLIINKLLMVRLGLLENVDVKGNLYVIRAKIIEYILQLPQP